VACFDDSRGWCGFGGEAVWLGHGSSGGAVASRDGRTTVVTRPGCAGGTKQQERHSGPEREIEREVRLTDGNGAAWGRLSLDGAGDTGRGRRGVEAAAQRTQTGVGAAASDQRSGFGHGAGGFE
jgi:hypothetical protein